MWLPVCSHAIFKDEAPYFQEWIEYHRLVGVDHFYLYDNGSTDNFREVLAPYMEQGIVTLIDWPDTDREHWEKVEYAWVFHTQAPALVNACTQLAKSETKWLAMIDIDEFIVPKHVATVPEALRAYADKPGVTIRWHVYGTSGVQTLAADGLLIEALNMTAAPDHYLNAVEKSIIKPELFDSFIKPPHTCSFVGGHPGVAVPKAEIQINHYINRTVEYFNDVKVKRREAMDNVKLDPQRLLWWSRIGNDITDQEKSIHRFIPKLRTRLAMKKGEGAELPPSGQVAQCVGNNAPRGA